MHGKIMHHCAFLIITFSTCAMCIQNGRADLSSSRSTSAHQIQARQSSSFHQSDFDPGSFIPSTGGAFRFPETQHQSPTPQENTNPYPNNNQRANPHNFALNTGEYPSVVNNQHNHPYRPHPNAIPSFANRQSPDGPSYANPPAYYNYPNYPPPPQQPHPPYAQAYDNYLFNRQPNYNRRPTVPPSPGFDGPYHDGHLTPPYRGDLTSQTTTAGASAYPAQYANQFGNFLLPFVGGGSGGVGALGANPLGGLLNSIAGGNRNPLSMQIIRGLENIARNDDLQCVPKVLCQMLGSPTRRAQLPGFITSPAVTSFVSALPASSPALIFGRAALLGLSGGEYSCSRTYARCPQNEDDILYYLNNHRGGFFKFFSDADSPPILDPAQHASGDSSTASPSQPLSIFNFLTGLGSSSNTNPSPSMSDAVTNGIGSLFGSVLSGFLNGQQGATRRQDEDENFDLTESNSTTPDGDGVEGRILNNKNHVRAYEDSLRSPISFPPGADSGGNDNYEAQQFETEFRFPSGSSSSPDRGGKRVNFIDAGPVRTKMIFPDRTGTGNLRFDNDEYFRVGKIMNRPSYNTEATTNRRPSYTEASTRRTPYYTKAPVSYLSGSTRDVENTSGNVYVTNGQGVIEYYINSQGKKVYV